MATNIVTTFEEPRPTAPLKTKPGLPTTSQTLPTPTFVSTTTTTILGLSSTKIDTSPTTANFPSGSPHFLQSTSFPIPISLSPSVIASSHSTSTQRATEAFDITSDALGVHSTIFSSTLPTAPLGSEALPTATTRSSGRLRNGPSMNRILPIAITVPILLISIFLALYFLRRRRRMRATLLPYTSSQSRLKPDDFDDWNWDHSSGDPISPFNVFKDAEKVNGATTTNCAKTRPPVATPSTNDRLSVHKILNSVSRRPLPLTPKEARKKLPNIPEPLQDISNDGVAIQIYNPPDVVLERRGQQHAPAFSRTRTFLMDQVEALQERLRFIEDNALGHGEQNTRGDHGGLDGELREFIPPPRYTTII